MRIPLLALALAIASPARSQPLIQAESALESRQVLGGDLAPDRKLSAWGGACLGNDWGRRIGDYARFSIQSSGGPQVLHLRYARVARQGEPVAKLRASIANATPIDFELPETPEWDVWRWLSVPLGAIARGEQMLQLESLTQAPLNLDALVVAPQGQVPPEVALRLLFESAEAEARVRVQLSPGVGEVDGEKLLARAREVYESLHKYLGEEPERAITVHIIGPDQAGANFVGHANGLEMYLEAARAEDTGHNWVHEMTHCFQRASGDWPTWLSEGEAWLAYYDAESELWKREPAEITFSPAYFRERLPQYRAALIVDERNWLQRWGQPDFPRDKVGAAYGFSNFILGELRQKFGPELMKRYRALLRADYQAGKRDGNGTVEERDTRVVERLGRASGENLKPLFRGWGFGLEN